MYPEYCLYKYDPGNRPQSERLHAEGINKYIEFDRTKRREVLFGDSYISIGPRKDGQHLLDELIKHNEWI